MIFRGVLKEKFKSLCVERGISPSLGFIVLQVGFAWKPELSRTWRDHFFDLPPISLIYDTAVLTSDGKIFSVVLPRGLVYRAKYLESFYAKKWREESTQPLLARNPRD